MIDLRESMGLGQGRTLQSDTLPTGLRSLVRGLLVKISIKQCISVPDDCFYLIANCVDSDKNAALSDISSGFLLFAKVPVYQYPE